MWSWYSRRKFRPKWMFKRMWHRFQGQVFVYQRMTWISVSSFSTEFCILRKNQSCCRHCSSINMIHELIRIKVSPRQWVMEGIPVLFKRTARGFILPLAMFYLYLIFILIYIQYSNWNMMQWDQLLMKFCCLHFLKALSQGPLHIWTAWRALSGCVL